MKSLIYYTVGYNSKYIDLIDLSLKTLNYYHPDEFDTILLCDESMYATCKDRFKNINVISCKNSPTPEAASMRKLDIFDYNIMDYDKVLFIDSDILIHTKLDSVLNNITTTNKLYVCQETKNMSDHSLVFWSLLNYTNDDLAFFKENNIYVFNAGLFGFIPDKTMKIHFDNIRNMIKTYKGEFFYEQSFMNVYFNKLNMLDYNAISFTTNYVMHPKYNINYEGNIVHFCGGPGNGMSKYNQEIMYIKAYMKFIK